MSTIHHYSTHFRLQSNGSYQAQAIPAAETFLQNEFAHFESLDDREIQKHLFYHPDAIAHQCLHYYISYEIVQVCLALTQRFGQHYNFVITDFLYQVLEEETRSLSAHILTTFNPQAGSLQYWVSLLVQHHPPLVEFLVGKGILLISDWALLNHVSIGTLSRVLREFYSLTPTEIASATHLLESYHQVYRHDRQSRQDRRRCPEPTDEQLARIAFLLQQATGNFIHPAQVLTQLLQTAQKLRQYRIYRRGGPLPSGTVSIDDPDTPEPITPIPSDEDNAIDAFLDSYRHHFLTTLDAALNTVVQDRLHKKPQKAQKFLTALEQFHCQQRSMTEIAEAIGEKRQDSVTRLLKLKEFRADVRHLMLRALKPLVQEQAALYVDPDRLEKLDAAIEAAIAQQLDALMETAKKAASTAKEYVISGLFTERLCLYLHEMIEDP